MNIKTSVSGCSDNVDISTNCSTISTPSASTVDTEKANVQLYSTPQPGKIFMISARTSGQILTLLDGKVSLQRPATPGSAYHWMCEERNGWLGFKNTASAAYLGHDGVGYIEAAAQQQKSSENFCVRLQPNGGFVLLMATWCKLCPVKQEVTKDCLLKLRANDAPVKEGTVWHFIEV